MVSCQIHIWQDYVPFRVSFLGRTLFFSYSHMCQCLLGESISENVYILFALLCFIFFQQFESFRFYVHVLNLFPVDLFFFNKVRDIDLVSFFCIWILSIMCIICWRGCNFSSVCFWQVCPKLDVSDYVTSLLFFYSIPFSFQFFPIAMMLFPF